MTQTTPERGRDDDRHANHDRAEADDEPPLLRQVRLLLDLEGCGQGVPELHAARREVIDPATPRTGDATMKTFMRIAVALNLFCAAALAANGSFGYALFNFVAACSIAVPMDDLFGSTADAK